MTTSCWLKMFALSFILCFHLAFSLSQENSFFVDMRKNFSLQKIPSKEVETPSAPFF